MVANGVATACNVGVPRRVKVKQGKVNTAGPAGRDYQPGGEAGEPDSDLIRRTPRQKAVNKDIHGTVFTVIRSKGVETSICLEGARRKRHCRCAFGTLDKDHTHNMAVDKQDKSKYAHTR